MLGKRVRDYPPRVSNTKLREEIWTHKRRSKLIETSHPDTLGSRRSVQREPFAAKTHFCSSRFDRIFNRKENRRCQKKRRLTNCFWWMYPLWIWIPLIGNTSWVSFLTLNNKAFGVCLYLKKRNLEVEGNVVNGRYFVVSRSTSE